MSIWGLFISNFFTAVSTNLLNSFDKLLSSYITLSKSTKFACEHCESSSDRKGFTVFQNLLLSFIFLKSINYSTFSVLSYAVYCKNFTAFSRIEMVLVFEFLGTLILIQIFSLLISLVSSSYQEHN